MTATRDELLEWLERLREDSLSCDKKYNPIIINEREKKIEQIRSILNLHFSISDSERKEAVEAIKKQMPDVKSEYFAHSFIVFKSDDKIIKTIFKSLGEKPE